MTGIASKLSFGLLAAALSLAGCKTIGEQLGSSLGYTVGSQVGGYAGGFATTTGTVLGGVLGGELADLLDEESQRRAATASGEAITSGKDQTWSNPDAGTSGQVTVVAQKQETANVQVEVAKDQVQELPPVDLIGRTYIATGTANVRGGPGTEYKSSGSLAAGEAVNVVGKVRGKNWYMISQGDVVIGFVSTTLLAVAPETKAAPKLASNTKLKGPVVTETIKVERTCRTAEHTVTLGNGEQRAEEIEACETPTGWTGATRPVAPDGKTGARPT